MALQAYYSFDNEELAGLMGVAPDSLKNGKGKPAPPGNGGAAKPPSALKSPARPPKTS